MKTRIAAFLLFAATAAYAHPPVGIVVDRGGNVYYSDLKQVWRLAPDGTKTVVVPRVHTHELYLDAEGNLYGEHLWYEGEKINKWDYYVWRRSPDGRVQTVYGPKREFRTDYSFVRDAAGNHYWADRDHGAIMKNKTVLARGRFRDIRWMTAAPDGTVYLIDAVDLVQVSPNSAIRTVARNLSSSRFLRPDIGAHHLVMGLWVDPRGNVCVADYAHGEVKRVAPDGGVTVIAKSRLPWSIVGGTYAPNGDLWLLEWSVGNEARVRRVLH
ncbi:MAG TPA: hypothetical protein VJZ76_14085 [Thermoanaerobaculia bacterium]|nr:hypothetical protein [Thermoanaerobaculia bacterium]